MLVSYFCCIFSLAGAVAHGESPRPLCHGARTFIWIYISLAKILKSEGGDSFGNCFLDFFSLVGWSKLLIFTDFHLPLLFLSSPLLPLLGASPPQTSKNQEKWTGSASLKTIGFKQGSQL
jgi:hypothetical protein